MSLQSTARTGPVEISGFDFCSIEQTASSSLSLVILVPLPSANGCGRMKDLASNTTPELPMHSAQHILRTYVHEQHRLTITAEEFKAMERR
jgi:hypothetical protein